MRRMAPEFWWELNVLSFLLWPISQVYRAAIALRRLAYRLRLKKRYRAPVPVIVVGGVMVGGAGKTPFTIWLARLLTAKGRKPGVVLRGYGGNSETWPRSVNSDSDPAEVGDESVLIAARTGVPVCVGPDRADAARQLVEEGCDLIVSDDGLQHYALDRDIEIGIVDSRRRFGNGMLLPAGPLREPASRLRKVHWVVSNGPKERGEYRMDLRGDTLVRLDGGATSLLSGWQGREVHAAAGIGDPSRFFSTLKRAGLVVREHPFPDHHAFTAEDLDLVPRLPLLITEKDAVKCRLLLPAEADVWFLPVFAVLDPHLEQLIMKELEYL